MIIGLTKCHVKVIPVRQMGSILHPPSAMSSHRDSDLYSSALFCLTSLNRIIPRGSIIIFDDLSAVLSEYLALTHYATAYLCQWRFIAATEGFEQAAVEITE